MAAKHWRKGGGNARGSFVTCLRLVQGRRPQSGISPRWQETIEECQTRKPDWSPWVLVGVEDSGKAMLAWVGSGDAGGGRKRQRGENVKARGLTLAGAGWSGAGGVTGGRRRGRVGAAAGAAGIKGRGEIRGGGARKKRKTVSAGR